MSSTITSTSSLRPLTPQQLHILTTLYKFRYITAALIQTSQGAKHKRVILARLKILEDKGYIGKNYDKTYKLLGKPASYYLLPKGIQILRGQPFASEKVLKRAYYDKNQDDIHVAHRLNVFKTYIYLKQHYPNQFQFYSKTELSTWKTPIPRDLTDGYLQSKDSSTNYFISYYEASAKTWRINNSIRRYIAYAEKETWQTTTKQDFPKVMLVCEDERLQRRVQRMAEQAKDESWVDISFEVRVLL